MGAIISKNKMEIEIPNAREISNEFQFTRYLYEKDEVKLNVIINLLNKNDDAIYWAYELYYSGFKEELRELIWSIYYDFYAQLNPSFEKYLSNKLDILLNKNNEEYKIVAVLINNFLIRPYSLDVFMMRNFVKIFEFEKCSLIVDYLSTNKPEYISKAIINYLEKKDYMILASLFLVEINDEHLLYAFDIVKRYFKKLGVKIIKESKNITQIENNYRRVLMYSRILMYFIKLKNITIPKIENEKKIKLGRNVYIHVEPEEVVLYETILADTKKPENKNIIYLPARKILQKTSIHAIDEGNYLSLFNLKRDKNDIIKAYREKWLYHAAYSPIWYERIQKFHGKIDHRLKYIDFEDYDEEEYFYDLFNYEPDEQSIIVQNKCIQPIQKKRNWKDFYNEHNKNCIIEIDDEYLDDIDKIEYF